jgi:integrase
MTPIGVRGVVVRRAAEAGLADRIRGTHVIRHSVASRWIQASDAEQIADRGHRSIDTHEHLR